MEKTAFLNVNGMTCRHSVEAVESALEAAGGVKRIEVSLDDNVIEVQYESDEITVEGIKEVIEDQGYDVDGDTV